MLALIAALPILLWQAGANTAPTLKQAGITHVAVPASQVDSWKRVSGITAEAANVQSAIKLPSPGVSFHMSEASASRVPWVNSNGWQFIRKPDGRFYYDVTGNAAALAAAEAFCYDAHALVRTDASGLQPFADMLKFLGTIPPAAGPAVADIGFVDDGSAVDAEAMNLLVRDNLLFRIVHSPEPGLKLTVRIGSKEYPEQEARNPNVLEHKIRTNLTDAQRTIRIYGISVVVARVTGSPGRLHIQFLNYGAARGTRVGTFRVRILGRYAKAQLHSFGNSADHPMDYTLEPDATEFTVPELKVYTAVDLSR
jgi:hypothetical protein